MSHSFTKETLEKMGLAHAMDSHPDLPLLDPAQMIAAGIPPEEAVEFLRARHQLIHRQETSPYYAGWEPRSWQRARQAIEDVRKKHPDGVISLLLSGGNRSSKSEFSAKYVMQTLVRKKRARAWILQATESVSIAEQQRYLWKYFPPEWKPESGKLKKGISTSISYNEKSGFSGNTVILPNGSFCGAKFYASEVDTLEGAELDIVWADELIPLSWLDPVRFRLATRNGIFLVSFTPVKGYSPTYGEFLNGAAAVEETELLIPVLGDDGNIGRWDRVPDPKRPGEWEKVPLTMVCRDRLSRVVYFHTMENHYGGPASVAATAAGKPVADIKLRLYGIARSKKGQRFGFRAQEHVITAAQRIETLRADCTITHVFDPAPGRNPFMQWWATLANGQSICVREWPQAGDYIPGIGDPGDWALPGVEEGETREKADGKKGPAQDPMPIGGLLGISREVRRVEQELGALSGKHERIPVFERFMDSRAAAAPTLRASESTTLIQEFENLGADNPSFTEFDPSLVFEPAPGGQKDAAGDDWITIINAMLDRDPMLNAPRLLVAECCAATIFSLSQWTGADGDKGACKDPVDDTKYFWLSSPVHIPGGGVPRKKRQTGYTS